MKRPKLDTRIRFLKRFTATDETYGTKTDEWLIHAEAWAEVLDDMPSKTESVEDDALEVFSQGTRIRFRWRKDISPDMRILVLHSRERTLEIVGGVAEIGGRKAYMEVKAAEISTND